MVFGTYNPCACGSSMRILIDDQVKDELEELTGKKLTKNGNSMISEVVQMAKESREPEPIEISCCEKTEKLASEPEKEP